MNPVKDGFIDFRKQRFSSLKNIIIERCDTSNYKALSLILNKYKPNYIYHTAALPLAKVSNLNNEEAAKATYQAIRESFDKAGV